MINLNHEFKIIARYSSLRQYIIKNFTSDQIYRAYYANNCSYILAHHVAIAIFCRYRDEVNSVKNGINAPGLTSPEKLRREIICMKVNLYINSVIREIFTEHREIINAASFYISALYPNE